MTATTDRSEQSSEQEEVVVGFLGRHGQLHALVNNLVKMRLQHLFILRSKQAHGAKDKLEQLEVEVGSLHVGAHLMHPVQQILDQYGGEDGRGHIVGQEADGHDLKGVVLVDPLHHKVNCLGEDLLEGEGVKEGKDSCKVLKNLLLFFGPEM